MAISSRSLGIGAAVIVAGAVAIVTVRALSDRPAAEPASSGKFVPAAPSSTTPRAAVVDAGAPDSAAVPPSATVEAEAADAGSGPQTYDLSEIKGAIGPPLRPMDREIFDFIASGKAKRGITEDVFPKKPYRVRMLAMGSLVTRVWVDLNRNGKWDEKWDLKRDQVDRHFAPEDDENYDVDFRLRGGHWLPY